MVRPPLIRPQRLRPAALDRRRLHEQARDNHPRSKRNPSNISSARPVRLLQRRWNGHWRQREVFLVKNALHQTVRAWDGSYYVPRISREQLGEVGRIGALCLVALGLLYCGSVGYGVIQDLREVKLVELRHVLHRVSVGDAILSWFGYVIGRDLLRAALGRDRA